MYQSQPQLLRFQEHQRQYYQLNSQQQLVSQQINANNLSLHADEQFVVNGAGDGGTASVKSKSKRIKKRSLNEMADGQELSDSGHAKKRQKKQMVRVEARQEAPAMP